MSSDLSGYKKILIFGGTFDPPHDAHVTLPQQVARAIGADLIAYLPAGLSPHKVNQTRTPAQHRLNMLKLELAQAAPKLKQPRVKTIILTDELERETDRPSYTVETLESIKTRIDPQSDLRLLIGSDQLLVFNKWYRPERIIELAEPIVMVRPPQTRQSLLEQLPESERPAWSSRLINVDRIDISSSQIRSADRTEHLLSPDVAAYIDANGLYR